MSALDEQGPKVWIAFLGDVQLRLTASGVAACRLQTDVAARIATLREAVGIFESQDVGQRHQRAHAMNPGQQRNFRVGSLPEIDDLAVVLADLKCERLILCSTGSMEMRRAGLRSMPTSDLMIRLLDPISGHRYPPKPIAFPCARRQVWRRFLRSLSCRFRRISSVLPSRHNSLFVR
jgi:hypothetical protein